MTRFETTAVESRFREGLVLPFLVLVSIAVTVVRWPGGVVLPAVALPLFVLVSITAVGVLLPWRWLTGRRLLVAMTAYMLLGALLLPLAHATTAVLLPYSAAATAGGVLVSRKAATWLAAAGALVAACATLVVGHLAPATPQWPWWIALTVGLPVYGGIANRARLDALRNARRAAEEALRASESEAREAALLERGRIAREIHDVLGHSLSGIALQLDMADALRGNGCDEEAAAAVRRARALAVDSISETRRAVHALRESTLPLPETLGRLAEHNAVDFAIDGEVAPVGVEAAHTVVRVAQEALTNTAKHAPGAPRTLRLAFVDDRVTLTVHNGPATAERGGEPAGGTGVGLVGMRERAALLGGTLKAEPAQDGGWTVELELPR
ncbi:sensor histidine kinase [Umezawaea tangerina]|uniref:sensor histidine kinase n=1 Tax=Umezawaea tangerina TaxID=84725 RepID=UPI000D0642FF|nr:histidine kinase [Umezawaea tangerina]